MTATLANPITPKPITLAELLAGADELASLPQVVIRVIDLTASPNATAADLERIISLDQAMAGKILALANSAYYGLPRRLSSLREAVVFLGFKAVRSLAMAITTFALFLGKSDALSLARRAMWRHSVDAAQCARVVTSRLPAHVHQSVTADEAFTCGLLHDIGKMLFDVAQHDVFMQIVECAEARNLRFCEVEQEFVPFGHSLAGAALTRHWNLPPPVCEAVAFHHTPRAAEINPRLTATVALANEIAHFLEGGADENDLRARTEEDRIPLYLAADSLPSLVDACRLETNNGFSQIFFG